ncbi:EamA family transporter [Vibrio aestuarianus]|nr:EamA family transporter [Vibrio aestuarianus]
MKLLLVGIVVILNIAAHVLFKYASDEIVRFDLLSVTTNWKIILGGLFQVAALITWLKLLQNVELYWAGLMMSLVPLGLVFVSTLLFKESLSLTQCFGSVLIIIGVLVIN